MSAHTLDAYGITVPLPSGWEGRAMVRDAPPTTIAPPAPGEAVRAADITGRLAQGWPGERTFPVVHLGNFALPPNRGDFGSGAVERMTGDHVFVTIFEYGPESVGEALFANPFPRSLELRRFNPNALQRRIPGQAGLQVFCNENGRAFCVFVVLGAAKQGSRLLKAVNTVLPTVEVHQP